MAGRGAYRVALYGAGLGLLALWGEGEFARYASAIGSVTWLTLLVASGPEKAALALIPRPGGPPLERLFTVLAALPFSLCAVVWLVLAAAGGPPAARYAAAAAVTSGVGCCTVLVALYRLRGRPLADPAAFLGIAAGYAAAVGLAVRPGLTASGVLALLVGVLLVVNMALLGGLARQRPASRRVRPARPAGLAALWAAAVLGVGELLSAASVSVLYAVFAATGDAAQTSQFYLLIVASAVLSAGWGYLLRIRQPQVVGWLRRSDAGAGWRLAGRLLGAVLALGVPLTAVLAIAIAWDVPRGVLGPAAVVLELAIFATTVSALLLVENIDAGGRRWSATVALIQFLTVAVAGWLLVPTAGAVGGFVALIGGELIKAAVLRAIVVRRARAAAVESHVAGPDTAGRDATVPPL
ncbi:hypothetical protein [Plantactinospora sp. GCM10030261]|uniref:hypothetical protein n=1 Tax=Plantactinospora sp. GCM10030261 TaxID=3273420 RepID=UPI00360E32E9